MKTFGAWRAAVLFVMFAGIAWSQSDCDLTVKGVADRPEGYRQRGDRCEGLYWRPHAMEKSLSVAGVRRVSAADWPPVANSVRIAWSKKANIKPNAEVSVKSVLLRSDMYYRMDAAKTYSAGAFEWPGDVLQALHLEFKDLGLFASTSARIGHVTWQVYLPLDVGPPAAASSTYEITVVPGTALLDLSWECSKLDADGNPAARLAGQKLKRALPAGVPIRLQISLPQFEGYSYVEIDADALSPDMTEPLHEDFVFFASR